MSKLWLFFKDYPPVITVSNWALNLKIMGEWGNTFQKVENGDMPHYYSDPMFLMPEASYQTGIPRSIIAKL